jgi:hypothetical protein
VQTELRNQRRAHYPGRQLSSVWAVALAAAVFIFGLPMFSLGAIASPQGMVPPTQMEPATQVRATLTFAPLNATSVAVQFTFDAPQQAAIRFPALAMPPPIPDAEPTWQPSQ